MVRQDGNNPSDEIRTSNHDSWDEAALELENELHALDADLNTIRQRIYLVEHGLTNPPDRAAELDRLRTEFDELSQQFVEAYRRWNSQGGDTPARGSQAETDHPRGQSDTEDR